MDGAGNRGAGVRFFAINMLMLGADSGFLLNAIGIARARLCASGSHEAREALERGVHRAVCAFRRGGVRRVQEACD